MYRWIPNAVTASRGLLGIPVAGLLLTDHHLLAFYLFIFAICTDLVDGWLARRLGAVSEAGGVLDPLSDKMLVSVTWIALLVRGWAPPWLAGPILLRDVLVAIGWSIGHSRGMQFKPTLAGRLKISYEGVTLPLLLLHVEWAGVHWMSAGVLLGLITLALAVISAVEHAVQAARGPPRG